MRVRLKQAATVIVKDLGEVWFPVGGETDIPDASFDPAFHEDLSPSPEVAVAPPPAEPAAAS